MFLAASMQRWNDHVRPLPLTELDKQAHKMIIAHMLARDYERTNKKEIKWNNLVMYGFFDLMQRVALTDIKPQVFNRLPYKSMTTCVLKDSGGLVASVHMSLGSELQEYLKRQGKAGYRPNIEEKILGAAHSIASIWEYGLIRLMNGQIELLENPGDELKKRLDKCKIPKSKIFDYYSSLIDLYAKDIQGLTPDPETDTGTRSLIKIIDICGRLRFQQRWSHSPRLPATSVLGHMLYVGYLIYLVILDSYPDLLLSKDSSLLWRNFYSALYHDLPEAMTRDIISPVKKQAHLDDSLKDIERDELKKIFKLLGGKNHKDARLNKDMRFYLPLNYKYTKKRKYTSGKETCYISEFDNRQLVRDRVMVFGQDLDSIQDLYELVDQNFKGDFILGEIIKVCDDLAAYIEACSSLAHGISSSALIDAEESMFQKYKRMKLRDTDVGALFKYFKDLRW